MRVLIVRNNYNPKALEASLLLEAFFDKQHIDYQTYDRDDLRSNCSIIDQFPTSEEPAFNLAVVLGGDGTILCTANQIGTRRIPILCVNFGHLGFMANPNDEGIIQIVSEALAGEVSYEARTNLQVEVYCEDDLDAAATKQDDFEVYPLIHKETTAHTEENASSTTYSEPNGDPHKNTDPCDRHTADPILKGEGEPQRFFALNEMVIARGDQGRMIGFSYSVSDSLIANMRSDGLIVASATGSTGYALSVGGPLVDPSYQGLVVAPIAPHTLQSRALLTGASDVVEIDLDDSPASRAATLFIDGERITFDSPIKKIVVATGEEPTLLLRYHSQSFYKHAASAFFKQ